MIPQQLFENSQLPLCSSRNKFPLRLSQLTPVHIRLTSPVLNSHHSSLKQQDFDVLYFDTDQTKCLSDFPL